MSISKTAFRFFDYLLTFLCLVAMLILLLKIFVFQQVTVFGISMQPNYHDYELLMVNQLDKNFHRGQVVAAYEDKNLAQKDNYWTRQNAVFLLKRVIGLPGEKIEIFGKNIIIYNQENPNGKILKEEYIDPLIQNEEDEKCKPNPLSINTQCYMAPLQIPENNYFLMGDNRSHSKDSRMLGTFPQYSLIGQENVRFWPMEKFRVFNLPTYQFEEYSVSLKDKITEHKKNLARIVK